MDLPTRIRRRLARAAGCLLLLVPAAPAQAQTLASPPAQTPAPDLSFAGTWPCADCAGRQVTLTLFGDQVFRLRIREHDERGATVRQAHDIGRWGGNGKRRVLRGGHEAPMVFELGDDGALRRLDAQGQPAAAAALPRLPEVDRLPGPMPLHGMYVYFADAATLTECLSGRRWPVLIEDGHLALERAYLDWRSTGGEGPVRVSIVGRFESRAPEPGLAPREVIRVERFDRLWPRETCAAESPARATLVNVRWRIVEIDGRPVTVAAGQREPFVRFAADGNRVRGFGGCSPFAGRFAQGADGLDIRDLATTPVACAAAAQQAALLEALRATAARTIVGDALQLRDADGRVRLRAEALYLR